MKNQIPKPHRNARLPRRVERVVVAIEAIQERRLPPRLHLHAYIWRPSGRRAIDRRLATTRSAPAALADEEVRSDAAGVHFARSRVEDLVLLLDDRAPRGALVVDAEDRRAKLERLRAGARRQRLQDREASAAVDDAARVEPWDVGDR